MARNGGDPWRIDQGALPSDDALWRDPGATWSVWAGRTGLRRDTIAHAIRARGWQKKPGGWTHAPCRLCGASMPIAELDDIRCCLEPCIPLAAVEILREPAVVQPSHPCARCPLHGLSRYALEHAGVVARRAERLASVHGEVQRLVALPFTAREWMRVVSAGWDEAA